MHVDFAKMHGLGNDFVVLASTTPGARLSAEQARRIADRRHGVGCDQVLLVEHADGEDSRFGIRVYNADGSEVGQCGNGVRCAALFVSIRGISGQRRLSFRTVERTLHTQLADGEQVMVDMGVPLLDPGAVPFRADGPGSRHRLALDSDRPGGETVEVGVVSLGNPHCVLEVDDVESAPVHRLGPAIQAHPRFSEGVNVGFMQVVDRSAIRLRVYERGSGETLACGSGACAAVVVGRLRGDLAEEVEVGLPGGRLRVRWDGADAPVWMEGPATWVYDGSMEL